ncbi:hypothetical protein VaNZ11_015468 [Volvox africanus]|uniref:K Homology domain-containing protein n=1 Tax=Volvox africanus TaxID=51714 RepID=A0ABQ5SMB9_9CHLO|nr:hypothetical protein VaNZ11_015468 [Volvox africanus]
MAYQVVVSLEGILSAGAVIGKKGRNARWIKERSGGARLKVSEDSVLITAQSASIAAAAARLLRAQIAANRRLASPAHPMRTDVVLGDWTFGCLNPLFRFCRAGDDAAKATGRQEQLFLMSPCSESDSSSDSDLEERGLLRRFMGFSLQATASASISSSSRRNGPVGAQEVRARRGITCFHDSGLDTRVKLMDALEDAARKARANAPSFDVLKVRFNLGKQYFCNLDGLEQRHGLRLKNLKDLQSDASRPQMVFSNFVPSSAVPRITSWLTGFLGFSLVNIKTTATLHVIDDALNVKYAVALTLNETGNRSRLVILRKVKSASTKCHTVVLLSGPEGLDLRIKLLGQRRELQDPKATAVAAQIVQICNSMGYSAATGHGRGGAAAKGLLPPHTTLDTSRKKTKRVYMGTYYPHNNNTGIASHARTCSHACKRRGKLPNLPSLMKLSVVTLEDTATGETHTEITGTIPELNFWLEQLMLRDPGGGNCAADSNSSSGNGSGGDGDSVSGDDVWCVGPVEGLGKFLAALNSGILQGAAREQQFAFTGSNATMGGVSPWYPGEV